MSSKLKFDVEWKWISVEFTLKSKWRSTSNRDKTERKSNWSWAKSKIDAQEIISVWAEKTTKVLRIVDENSIESWRTTIGSIIKANVVNRTQLQTVWVSLLDNHRQASLIHCASLKRNSNSIDVEQEEYFILLLDKFQIDTGRFLSWSIEKSLKTTMTFKIINHRSFFFTLCLKRISTSLINERNSL